MSDTLLAQPQVTRGIVELFETSFDPQRFAGEDGQPDDEAREAARAEVLDPVTYPGALAVTDGAPVPGDVPYRPGQDLINNMWPLPAQ